MSVHGLSVDATFSFVSRDLFWIQRFKPTFRDQGGERGDVKHCSSNDGARSSKNGGPSSLSSLAVRVESFNIAHDSSLRARGHGAVFHELASLLTRALIFNCRVRRIPLSERQDAPLLRVLVGALS